ncbi:MAG: TSUP family transporter [Sedimenticola sp.]
MPDLILTPELLLLLFSVGLIAGMVDAIAGGGGLIALPTLLSIGLPPAQALATNKLQGSFGTFSSSLYFIRSGLVDLSRAKFLIGCTFVGSALGTLLVQRIDPSFLNSVIPLLLIAIALYFWLSPGISDERAVKRIGENLFALTVGFGAGFYDGFFGPGAGAFFAVGFVSLLGYGLTQATAHTKVLNFTSNIASLLFFILGGQVIWSLGLTMGCGQLIGGRLGAKLVIRKGARLIRPLIVSVTIIISLKLLLSGE